MACSSRNWPPQLSSLTHPGPRGSWGPKALSSPAPPELHTSSPGSCSSGTGPAARSRGSVSPRSSPSRTGQGRSLSRPHHTPAPLPALPAALHPLCSHLYAAPDVPDRGTHPRPTPAATVLTTSDWPAERRGPRAHTPPPRPSGCRLALPGRVWRRTAVAARCLLGRSAVAQAQFLHPARSSLSCEA